MTTDTAGCDSGWCWRRRRHAGRRRERYRSVKQHDPHDDGNHDEPGEYEGGCTAGQCQCGPSQHFH